jgi:hypothetical protein
MDDSVMPPGYESSGMREVFKGTIDTRVTKKASARFELARWNRTHDPDIQDRTFSRDRSLEFAG